MKYAWFVVTVFVAVAVQLAMFFFRLGYFMPLTWAAGLMLVVFITLPAWLKRQSNLVIIVTLYCLSIAFSYYAFFDHKRIDVQPMTWTIKQSDNQWKQREVVFEFVNHPGQVVGMYSDDVADYLNHIRANPIDVSFRITSDLGCVRGFDATRIGNLENWRSASGYSGSHGVSQLPWESSSWCIGR